MKKHNVYNARFSVPLFCKPLKRPEILRTSGTPLKCMRVLNALIVRCRRDEGSLYHSVHEFVAYAAFKLLINFSRKRITSSVSFVDVGRVTGPATKPNRV